MAGGLAFFSFTTEVAPGAGTKVAAFQKGDDSWVQQVMVSGSDGVPIDFSDPFLVEVVQSVLPDGASTSANQVSTNSKLDTIITNTQVRNTVYLQDTLKNAGSEAMNVNGSVTPQNFDYTASQTIYVESLSVFIQDGGATNPEFFGNLAALTNGLRMLAIKSSTEYELANTKTNKQLFLFMPDIPLIPTSGTGWFNNIDSFGSTLKFNEPILLNSGDKIRATVRDDLSALAVLSMSIRAKRYL